MRRVIRVTEVQETVKELLCDDEDGALGVSPPPLNFFFFFIFLSICVPSLQPRRRAPLRSLPAWTVSVSQVAGDATESQSVPTARTRPKKRAVSGDSQHTVWKSHKLLSVLFTDYKVVFQVSGITWSMLVAFEICTYATEPLARSPVSYPACQLQLI